MKPWLVSPSYRRAKTALSHKCFPTLQYVVSQKEYKDYVDEVGEGRVIACPDNVQGNIARVRNWILEQTGGSCIMLDDDVSALVWWEEDLEIPEKRIKTGDEAEELLEWCEHMAAQTNTTYWGVNVLAGQDKAVYQGMIPFSTLQFCGGPVQGHINNNLRYDERIPLKEDYDMLLQALRLNRMIWRFNMVGVVCKQQTMAGGCAVMRNTVEEKRQFDVLQKKWGSDIVSRGIKRYVHGRKSNFESSKDINPRVFPPIKGI